MKALTLYSTVTLQIDGSASITARYWLLLMLCSLIWQLTRPKYEVSAMIARKVFEPGACDRRKASLLINQLLVTDASTKHWTVMTLVVLFIWLCLLNNNKLNLFLCQFESRVTTKRANVFKYFAKSMLHYILEYFKLQHSFFFLRISNNLDVKALVK